MHSLDLFDENSREWFLKERPHPFNPDIECQKQRRLTVHRRRWRRGSRRDGVEDHAADAVDARARRAGLGRRVHAVGRARDRDPVRRAVRAHHAARGWRPAGDAERHGRGVNCRQIM